MCQIGRCVDPDRIQDLSHGLLLGLHEVLVHDAVHLEPVAVEQGVPHVLLAVDPHQLLRDVVEVERSGRSTPGACSVLHWSVCSARTQEIAWRNLSRRVMDTGCTFGKIGRGSASPTAGWY